MSCSLGWTLEEGEEPTARAVALGVALMALAAPVVALLALRERLRRATTAAQVDAARHARGGTGG